MLFLFHLFVIKHKVILFCPLGIYHSRYIDHKVASLTKTAKSTFPLACVNESSGQSVPQHPSSPRNTSSADSDNDTPVVYMDSLNRYHKTMNDSTICAL